MPPGWYQAAGDPPGTQRYWDGTQWQGGPQPVATAGGVSAPGGAQAAVGGGAPAAQIGARIVAALIDTGIVIGIIIVGTIVAAVLGAVADVLGLLVFLVTYLGALGFGLYNQIYLLGTTGQSIGKKQQGVKLLANKTGQPVGIGMVFVRGILGGILLDICLLDFFWMFKDGERLRLSDQILDFQVRQA